MKKKLISALLATALVATSLVGCGGSAATTEAPATEAPATEAAASDAAAPAAEAPAAEDMMAALVAATDGPVNLSVWAAEEDQEMVKTWCDEFKALYPEVELSFDIGVESESTAKDTILTDVEAAPDVFSFAGDQVTELNRAGALQEITLNKDQVIANCGGADAGAVVAATVDGKLMAYPATADNGYFMFYNKEYFSDEDVKTMDAMLKVCADNGKKMSTELTSGWYLLSYFVGAGFDLSKNEDGSTNINWNGESKNGIKGVDVAQAILDICENEGFVAAKDAEFATGVQDGSIIAGVNGTWNAEVAEKAWGENYAATVLPTYTCNGQQIQLASVAGYKMFGVSKHSENPGWAMALADYFTSEAKQIERFKLRQAGPANAAASQSAEVLANPAIAALSAQSKYAILDGCEGDNYWSTSETFGAILAAGNPDGTDLQTLLDNFVEGASQPSAQE